MTSDERIGDAVELGDVVQRWVAKVEEYQSRWPQYACSGKPEGIRMCERVHRYMQCDRAKDADCPRVVMQVDAKREAKRAAETRQGHLDSGLPLRCLKLIEAGLRDTTARAAVSAWDRDQRCFLVLAGAKGSGKTVAACEAIYAAYGRFAPVADLVRAGQYNTEALDELASAGLLVLDDLGTEYVDAKGFFLASLDWLVNARYSNEKATIITTNLPAKAFAERYGERVADRLREAGQYVEIADQSMRGKP